MENGTSEAPPCDETNDARCLSAILRDGQPRSCAGRPEHSRNPPALSALSSLHTLPFQYLRMLRSVLSRPSGARIPQFPLRVVGRRSIASLLGAKAPEHLEVLAHAKNLEPVRTPLRGRALLNFPPLNKGAAFTREERDMFGLEGLLPYEEHGLEMQCDRAYNQLLARTDPLSKYTFLASLRDQNQVRRM